jgi:hypothetical protein
MSLNWASEGSTVFTDTSRRGTDVCAEHTLSAPKREDVGSRLRLKYDGTCTDTRFRLSAKRTSPFKSAGAWVQSTTGSRGVRISGSNGGDSMFRGGVKSTGYPHHSPDSPFTSPPVRHRVPSHFNWTLQRTRTEQLTVFYIFKTFISWK